MLEWVARYQAHERDFFDILLRFWCYFLVFFTWRSAKSSAHSWVLWHGQCCLMKRPGRMSMCDVVHLCYDFPQHFVSTLRCNICTSRVDGFCHPIAVEEVGNSRRVCHYEYCGVIFCGCWWWEGSLPLISPFEFPLGFWERDKMVC